MSLTSEVPQLTSEPDSSVIFETGSKEGTPSTSPMENENMTPKDVVVIVDVESEVISDERVEKQKTSTEESLKRKRVQEEEKEAKKRKLEEDKEMKRRKLEEEKEAKRRKIEDDKLQRKLQLEEKKQKQEQERLLKKQKLEEEKEAKRRKLEEEKLAKKKKLEEEKAAKDALKKKVSDEKELQKKKQQEEKEIQRKERESKKQKEEKKKSKAQPTISAFFTIKKKTEEFEEKKPDTHEVETAKNEFDESFLDFFHKSNIQVYQTMNCDLDNAKNDYDNKKGEDLMSFFGKFEIKTVEVTTTTTSIIEKINSSSNVDEDDIPQLLSAVPFKYISFYENRKPPYCGTYSTVHGVSKDPFHQIPQVQYDIDSDWSEDEEEEGDEIGDDDELSENEEGDEEEDDIADFLEANEEIKKKIVTKLNPVIKYNHDDVDSIFQSLRYEELHPNIRFPIDPSCNYWPQQISIPDGTSITESVSSNILKPKNIDDNLPVSPLSGKKTSIVDGVAAPVINQLSPKKPKIVITDKKILLDLCSFIQENCEFTIGTLVDLTKKKFPTFTKGVLKTTIQDVAKRVGKASEQKWVVNQELFDCLKNEEIKSERTENEVIE